MGAAIGWTGPRTSAVARRSRGAPPPRGSDRRRHRSPSALPPRARGGAGRQSGGIGTAGTFARTSAPPSHPPARPGTSLPTPSPRSNPAVGSRPRAGIRVLLRTGGRGVGVYQPREPGGRTHAPVRRGTEAPPRLGRSPRTPPGQGERTAPIFFPLVEAFRCSGRGPASPGDRGPTGGGLFFRWNSGRLGPNLRVGGFRLRCGTHSAKGKPGTGHRPLGGRILASPPSRRAPGRSWGGAWGVREDAQLAREEAS